MEWHNLFLLSTLPTQAFPLVHSEMSTFVFCAHPGWVYLWTAQTEMMMHTNTSSRERRAKARLKSASTPHCPSPRRGEKATRGTLLLDRLHLYFYSYFPFAVILTTEHPDSYDFITCPGGSQVIVFSLVLIIWGKEAELNETFCRTLQQSRCLSLSLSLFSSRWLWINLTNCKYESGTCGPKITKS